MRHHRPRQHADHPDEERVLLLLNGELDSCEADAIGIHIERCRECQVKMQRLQKGLYVFVEYRQTAFLSAAGAPPKRWSEFPALLDRISTNT